MTNAPQGIAIVIRKDGTVPIDKMPDGSDHPHRYRILAALAAMGHELLHQDSCAHHKGHICTCNPHIQNWNPPQ